MWKHTETDHICAVKMAVTHYMLSILVRPTCTCSSTIDNPPCEDNACANPASANLKVLHFKPSVLFSHKQYKPVSIYL